MDLKDLLLNRKPISVRTFTSQFVAAIRRAEAEGMYYEVMKHSKNLGVFIPAKLWQPFIEEAFPMLSEKFRQNQKRIRELTSREHQKELKRDYALREKARQNKKMTSWK